MERRGHSYLDLTARPEIGALVLVPQPAWLWAIDGARLRWANAAGARYLGSQSIEALLEEGGDPGTPPANIAAVIGGLSAAPHMAKLDFGGEFGTVWCLCSRLELDNGALGLLAVATDERVSVDPLPVRAGRLVQSLAGNDMVAALVRPSGHIVAASDGVSALHGGSGIISDLAAELAVSGRRLLKRSTKIGDDSRLIGAAATNGAEGELTLVIVGPPEPPIAAPEPKRRAAPAPAARPQCFTFSLDPDQKFIAVSADLAAMVGGGNAELSGLTWSEAAEKLGLDEDGAVAKALQRRDTRSGIPVQWPAGGGKSVAVEMTLMPSFGRDGIFEGFRGFGVFRSDAAAPAEPAEAEPALPQAEENDAAPETNIVRLPSAEANGSAGAHLTGDEQDAFRRIADELRSLGGRSAAAAFESLTSRQPVGARIGDAAKRALIPLGLLDRVPIGMIVFRDEDVLFANRALLDRLGYPDVGALAAGGGIVGLFAGDRGPPGDDPASRSIPLRAADGRQFQAEARLHVVPWSDGPATMLSVREPIDLSVLRRAEDHHAALTRLDELEAVLDTATDGALVLDSDGRILRLNRSAEALFGIGATDMIGKPFTDLLAEESKKSATDYLDGLASNGVASVLNDGREVIGRVPAGGLIPLFMTMGRLSERGKFCVVLRDITQWKNAEEELIAARRSAELANKQKSEFLAKISHEIRTPLNAIIGFSDVIIEERFGPIGNERYREYLRDIRLSGTHLMSLINDLLDLSKIESGKLDLSFTAVPVNRIVQESVALMQPEANRRRIIIRTSLADDVPQVVADERSLRQIVLNLLSNAVKFNVAAGQVIVSTAVDEKGEVVLRIRDTGIGMSEKDIATALQPFQQIASSGAARFEGTGLGLPLTKALVEANRATFEIDSTPNQGTLVRISFPIERVLQP